MEILTQLCNWWWLAWLLPFILGLAFGWALWARYKQMKEQLEKELDETNEKLKQTEDDLAKCRSHNTDLDSQIANLKGRLREAVSAVERYEQGSSSKAVSAGVTSAKSPKKKTPAKKNPPASKAPTTAGKKKADDLKIVEGIGPKIEELLKAAGFDSLEKLSKAKIAALREVLANAGSRYSFADPGTWAKQAGLAAKGKMDELKKLQDSLQGGKKK